MNALKTIFLWLVVPAFIGLILGFFGIFSVADAVKSESYQDRYVIAQETYKKVVPSKYERIYKSVKKRDRSAARTMVVAAREQCINGTTPTGHFFGPDHPTRPFDCTSFRPRNVPLGAE